MIRFSGRRDAPTRLTFINHTLGKICLPNECRQAKYSEPNRARNMRIADIGTFSILRTWTQSIEETSFVGDVVKAGRKSDTEALRG